MTTPLHSLVDQFELDGIVWNARDADGVEWIVNRDADWWSPPNRRVNHLERPLADGYGRSRSFASVRVLTFEGCMTAPTRALRDARLDQLAAMFADGALHSLTGPGVDGQYELLVEYTDRPDIDPLNSTSVRWQMTLIAPDPLKKSVTEYTTGQIELPSTTGGLTFPFTAPFTFDATVTAGSALVTNGGTADIGLLIRIDGPATNPHITLARGTDVQTLRCNLTVDAGQWLTIDTAARTVMLNDLVSRRGAVSGDFPILTPGTSELSWDADTYEAAARLTATWRYARY